MGSSRRALAGLICGCIAILLPISILIALFGFSRQQLATTSDWVYGTIAVTTLAAAVAAVVLGHLSRKGPGGRMATAGLFLGYGVLLIPATLISEGINGRLANTPMRTNESLATGLVPVIQIALEEYLRDHGRYPESLAELGGRTAISLELLRTGRNNGYLYRYEVTPEGYRLRADPEKPGKTGRRRFDVTPKQR